MLSFDEINRLAWNGNVRSIDISQYINEMDGLTESQREDRIAFAHQLENQLYAALSFLFLATQYDLPNRVETTTRMVENAFLTAIGIFTVADTFLTEYASRFAEEFVDATIRNQGNVFTEDNPKNVRGAYYFSEDRARYNAENEANTVFNYEEFRDAKRSGLKYKQWLTMHDERVRRTHAMIDGTVIPIDDYFSVGEAQLLYPKMPGSEHPEEVINCRCVARFLSDEDYKNILRAV